MCKLTNIDHWRQYPIINELDAEDLTEIIPNLIENEYPDGTVILKQGSAGADFHIIASGTIDVCLEQETKVKVARLEAGSFFGEMSCLTGGVISATVQAAGTARTVSMARAGLLLLMDKSKTFRRHMIEAMVDRISDSNHRVVEEYTRSYAVLRQLENERKSRFGALAGDSACMMQLKESIPFLAREQTPRCIVGEKGVGKTHLAWEIHFASERAQYPILEVDAGSKILEEWEYRLRAAKGGTIVLKHSDQLPGDLLERLLQSAAEADTRIIMTACSTVHTKVRQTHIAPLRERKEDIPTLVSAFLLDENIANPEEVVSQEAMHLLTLFPYLGGNVRELKRVLKDALVLSGGKMVLARHLRFETVREPGTRPKIGLALGSGSVRGAAHVGVLKVLEQTDIPVDIITGTSVGAFIGALYAGGQPIANFEKVLPTVRWLQLVRPTSPKVALVSNHPMKRFVEKYIGAVNFDELAIPFACVASDAITGEAYILNEGSVPHAICATTAIPGVMKPVRHNGRLLLDGAIVNPVPVALAKSMGADIVIAVDVSVPPFAKREPKSFVATILNTIDIMSERAVREELQMADVVIKPDLQTNQMTFKVSASHIEMGVKATRDVVTTIKRKIYDAGWHG